eukprot:729008-Hanusia_phi.AAC.1
MRLFRGLLFLAGSFDAIDGELFAHVASWDGSRASPLAHGLNGVVDALEEHEGQLVAGGSFSAAMNGVGSLTRTGAVAAWDGSAWGAVGGGQVSGSVMLAASRGPELFVAGAMLVGAKSARVAKWDGSVWTVLAGETGSRWRMEGTMSGLVVAENALFVGGDLLLEAGTRANLARWDGGGWRSIAGVEGSVSSLALQGNMLLVASGLVEQGRAKVYSHRSGSVQLLLEASGRIDMVLAQGDCLFLPGMLEGGSGGKLLRWCFMDKKTREVPVDWPVLRANAAAVL